MVNQPPNGKQTPSALQPRTPTVLLLVTTVREVGSVLNSCLRGPLKGMPSQPGALSLVGLGRGLFVFSKGSSWGLKVPRT